MALSGNKGDWSELYALMKLLGDGGMNGGDADLNRLKDVFYPILKILRTEKDGITTYEYVQNIVLVTHNDIKVEIDRDIFIQKATELFNYIKQKKGEAAFEIPEIENFLELIKTKQLKAENTSKSDIKIVIHDKRTTTDYLLGFSIKSKLGSDSTIVNSSQLTNFIFRIDNISTDDVDTINKMVTIKTRKKDGSQIISPDIRKRLKSLKALEASIKYVSMSGRIYKNNLMMISEWLPNIIANMLLVHYSSEGSRTNEICKILEDNNPLEYDTEHKHTFYSYKVKKFLIESALGMIAKDVWTGYHDATGGYIVVKEDGDLLCYHLYNRNDFEDYLLNSTYFDTPSSSRNDFGYIYNKDGINYIALNIQVKYK